jgi:hypothetical protein
LSDQRDGEDCVECLVTESLVELRRWDEAVGDVVSEVLAAFVGEEREEVKSQVLSQ